EYALDEGRQWIGLAGQPAQPA
ncbi:MAG: hypothetical protein JWP41_3530, partial [Ramlibacter sp.]|nr:hypothetical protein [Ramlibacter sp.]